MTSFLLSLLLGSGTANAPAVTASAASRPVEAKPAEVGVTEPAPAGVTAITVVDKVQAFYQATDQLTAKFRQTVNNSTFGKVTVSDGNVYIKKPGKMRWDYFSRAKKTKVDRSFMSDGKILWGVFMGGKTYYKKDIKDDLLPVAITFLTGKGDLKKDFAAALDTSGKRGAKGQYVLELTPRKPSAQYKTLWLVVDRDTYRVKQSIILNSSNDVSTFEFFEPDRTAVLRDQTFVFNEKDMVKKNGFRLIVPPKNPGP